MACPRPAKALFVVYSLLAHGNQVCYTAYELHERNYNSEVFMGTEDTAPSGLGRARLALAISAGNLAGASGRFFRIGGGTSLPGMIARRIDPDVLKSVIGASKAKKIVITGSNGK